MDEYINREDVLKCLEYNTIQKPSANDVVSATLRVARERSRNFLLHRKERYFLSGATPTRILRKLRRKC